MGQEPALVTQRSATPCLNTSLEAAIPSWVNLRELDASGPYDYARHIPPNAGAALRAAARAYVAALSPIAPRALEMTLLGLRTATIVRQEHPAEAKASFEMLKSHLTDIPQDILEAACIAYCSAPGPRYFPRSAGELRAFTNAPCASRRGRAWRLTRLADQTDARDRDEHRRRDDRITPDQARAILIEYGLRPRA